MDMAPGSGSPWKRKVSIEKPEGEEAGTDRRRALQVAPLTPIAARAQITTTLTLQHRAFRDRVR